MAAKSSVVPDILWNWVIEALANFEQVDIHTLIGLVKTAPAISGDTGLSARELVSFRILEYLFARDNETIINDNASQKVKISFDASERCEDVLYKILNETPEVVAGLETEKFDVRPFLMHKRSSLPKCSLKKLKEAIFESSHPVLASLKERSKVVIPNVSEDINPVIDDIEATGDLSLNRKNDENKFQENVLREAEHDAHADSQHAQEQLHCNDGRNETTTSNERVIDGRNETTTSSEKVIDERDDIAAQKEAFLNSQVNFTQESFSMTEFSEIDICMKCNEGGQLLVCASESCMLRIHENCLGYDVTLGENDEFFCPFCAYSRAISEYLEAKKKASLARKDLQTFSRFKVKRIPNKSSNKQTESEKNETERNGNENTASKDKNINCMSTGEGSAVPDPPIPVCNVVHIEIGRSNEQTSESLQNPIRETSAPKPKRKEKENQTSPGSSCSLRPRKRKAQYVSPPLPLLRRMIIPWTKSEEEMLKEAVERHSDAVYKGIPWKEILYFGRNVFHKGRTTIDLKDKWRNICKGS